jgi:hypothetical protein
MFENRQSSLRIDVRARRDIATAIAMPFMKSRRVNPLTIAGILATRRGIRKSQSVVGQP